MAFYTPHWSVKMRKAQFLFTGAVVRAGVFYPDCTLAPPEGEPHAHRFWFRGSGVWVGHWHFCFRFPKLRRNSKEKLWEARGSGTDLALKGASEGPCASHNFVDKDTELR